MISNNSIIKIGVFYDGNFLLHTSNYYNYIHDQRRRISITGLHDFIRSRVAEEENGRVSNCKITEAHYFRGRINAVEASQRGNQLYNDRVFDDILMSEGIQTHYLPLRNLQGRKEERGIDVWLSLEAYELSLLRQLDVVVLVLSDTDYVQLFRKLTAIGVKVMLLSWEFEYNNDDGIRVITKTSHELLQLADYPVLMHEVIERGLESGDKLINDMFVAGEGRSSCSSEFLNEIYEVGEILSVKNGYGFIKYPNNNLFFHCQDFDGDFGELIPGDKVTFIIDKNNNKQDVAKNVRRLTSEEYNLYLEDKKAHAEQDELENADNGDGEHSWML